MIQRPKYATNLWLIGIALLAGGSLFFGIMPGMNLLLRADSQGIWTQTGFLDTPRTYLATATLLHDGDVLLAGGQAGQDGSSQGISNATAVAEIYHPSTGAFSSTGSMTVSRAGQTATLLDDGRVLIAGGINETWTYRSAAELYDPTTRLFTATGSMMTARAGHVAIPLPSGQVLMVGGHDGTNFLASAELYDPVTGVFTPTGPLHGARSNFSGVLLNSGKVLVLGGYGPPNAVLLHSAELYDPLMGTFTPTGSLHSGMAGFHQAVRLESGDVLVAGGVGPEGQGLSSAEIYSPQSGNFSMTGSMGIGRQHHSLTLLPNGQVLVAGGWAGNGGMALTSVEIFHPGTGVFAEVESLVTGRGFHTATLLNNGRVLVTGGSGEASFSSLALDSAELFFCSTCLTPPDAPTQVTAGDNASDEGGEVLISWTPSSSPEVQEYRVYSGGAAEGPFSLVATLPDASITTYRHTDLANGVLHHYVVRAFDGNQESENSNGVSAMALDNMAPNSPTALTVQDMANDDGTALSLSWTPSASDDVVEQHVYRGLALGGPHALVATISGNAATTFLDNELTANTRYYYVLSSFDGTQESPFTSEAFGQPQDNRPVAQALHFELAEDAAATITLLGEDPEEGSPVTYSITETPVHGHLSGQPPDLTYVPMPDFNGVDNFSYVVSKGALASQPANVVLTVLAMNDPPEAIDDFFTVEEDTIEAHLGVLANDTTAPDLEEVLTITSVSSISQHGTLTIAPDQQSLLFTPPANFHGTESLIYTMTDGAFSREATATVTVKSVNDAPSVTPFVLSWLPSPSSNVVEQRVYRGLNSGGPYQLIASFADPAVSSFVDSVGLDLGVGYFYVVRAFDGTNESVDSNEIQEVSGRRTVLVQEESSASVVLPGYDLDGDSLSYVILQHPQYGTITGVAPNLMYTPNPNFSGEDTLLFAVSDGMLLSESGMVTFKVLGINDAPIAQAQTLRVSPNGETSLLLTGNDGDPEVEQSLEMILESLPVFGRLALNAGGAEIDPSQLPLTLTSPELFYQAPDEGLGPDSFAFHVQDNGGTEHGGVDISSQASVSVFITPYSPTTLEVKDHPLDDGTALSLSWTPSISSSIVEQRVYRGLVSGGPYDLLASLSGNTTTIFVDHALTVDSSYYYVLSAFDGTQESLFTPEVEGQPRDNRPVAQAIEVNIAEDMTASITLLGEDSDSDHESFAIITTPANGQLSGELPSLIYTPALNFNGEDRFSYVVSDGVLTSKPAVVNVVISPRNDPPVAVEDVFIVEEDANEIPINVMLNDTSAPDVEEVLTITGVSFPNQGGGVRVDPDQQRLLYKPAANFSGTEIFSYTISDGSIGSEATASVTVTVIPVNDAPIAHGQTLQVSPNSETIIVLTGDDGDPDQEQTLNVVLDSLPTVGGLSLSPGDVEIIPSQLPLMLQTSELYYMAPGEGDVTATFAFHVQDNHGTENGGFDTSSQTSVTLSITP